MKKILAFLITVVIVLNLAACGSGAKQQISFQGINLEIPSSWKADKKTLSDDYAVYKELNKTGHNYMLVLQDTFSLLKTHDLNSAGAFFKEVTEDNASYTDVSDPVLGKLAGKYDMHTIECTYHAINVLEDDKESDYPCKLIRVYMDGHDVIIEFTAASGDFEAFETAMASATCTSSASTNDTSVNEPVSEESTENVTQTDAQSLGAAAASSSMAENDAVAALETSYSKLSEDALTWSYDEATKTITISGAGPMRDYLSTYPEWYQYCDTAEHVVIEDGVTSVGPGAFMQFWVLSDVSLGASVEFIGDSAFDYCWALRTVNFPAGLKYIGERGFYNTLLHSSSGFIFPEGLLYLGDDSFHSAFKESFVSLPASLIYIGETALCNGFVEEFRVAADNAFYTAENGILYDKAMTTLICYPSDKNDTVYEIPATVTAISDEAIQVTNTLEKIVIPASVTKIEEGAIFWNYALVSVEIDENNQSYKSVDGVLFTADGKTALCYPIAASSSEYTIPDGCERIGEAAFGFAKNLTTLYIPDGLKEIGSYAVYGCSGISQLDLPKSLTKIEALAFYGCDSLREIHYAGSSTDWENIEIDKDNNEYLFDGTINISFAE